MFTLTGSFQQKYNGPSLRPILPYFQGRPEVTVRGYCVRCRAKQEMLSATRTLMKNGRRAMIGVCACCGTRMSVMGQWDDEADPVPAQAEAAHPAPPQTPP